MHFKANMLIVLIQALLLLTVTLAQQTIKIADVDITWSKRSSSQTDFTLTANLPATVPIANAYIAVGLNSVGKMVSFIF